MMDLRIASATPPNRFASRLAATIGRSARGAGQPAKEDDQDESKDRRKDDDEADKERARKARKKAKDGEKPDPDDQDTEDDADPKARAARARERQRIAAIMSSAAARRDPVTAMHLCVDTTAPRGQAIALLGSLNEAADDAADLRAEDKGRGGSIMAAARAILRAGRKARGEIPAAAEPTDPVARRIIAAGRKARGEA